VERSSPPPFDKTNCALDYDSPLGFAVILSSCCGKAGLWVDFRGSSFDGPSSSRGHFGWTKNQSGGAKNRYSNSPIPPTQNQIAAAGCITAGGGRSSIAAAGISGGSTVHTPEYRRPAAAAGRLTAVGGYRRNSPSPPTRNQIAAGGCITAGGGRSSISAAGVAGGASVPTPRPRLPPPHAA